MCSPMKAPVENYIEIRNCAVLLIMRRERQTSVLVSRVGCCTYETKRRLIRFLIVVKFAQSFQIVTYKNCNVMTICEVKPARMSNRA